MGHMSDDITNAPIPVVRTASGKPMAATEIKATATTIEDVRQAGRRDGLREAAEYLDGIPLRGDRTVLDYLLKPLLKARHEAMTER